MNIEVKSWQEVLEEINNTTLSKSTLLGNGFSMAWDYKKFSQQGLKPEYLKNLEEENTETCIEALQKFEHNNGESYQKIAQDLIHNKIHADFMRSLFNKLPQRISPEKSKPFVDFLKIFDNYFSLNYDPLVYFLFNKFKKQNIPCPVVEETNNEDKTDKVNEKPKQKAENISVQEEIEQVLKPVIEKVLSASWTIEADGEKLLEEEINDQSHTFIRSKLLSVLKRKDETKTVVEKILTTGGNIKSAYNCWFNDTIANAIEAPIKDDLKVLEFNDGFLKQDKILKWDKSNECNYYHLHGAYHIVKEKAEDNKFNIFKISSTSKKSMMDEINGYMEDGKTPISILKGNAEQKKQDIDNNDYLKNCYENLEELAGLLVVIGVSFADNDNHIVKAIVENIKLEKVYIGVYKNKDTSYDNLANYKKKFNTISDKVVYFEVNDVFIEPENNEGGSDE